MKNGPCEDAPCCGCCGPQGDGDYYGQDEADARDEEQGGWDREDDLADYNDAEADDYANEGSEDAGLDAHFENDCGD